MKTTLVLLIAMMVASVAFASGHPQTTCPVMGNPIDQDLSVDVEGYRIYVCCAGCVDMLKAQPEEYIAQMKAQGIELEKAPERPMDE
ncbi:MAG: hypothetical protein PHO14_05080 [Kiritimatiellae bacterium]|jgi:hypothetical protein|nr:hypothetical protein [Kiritimatiellia bacterium]MDD4341589.1 hypothetical protein [Kiritimatiellia bacterium]MDY0149778.1 hypothetical protein [Kiritimatiellia bacterium]